MTNLLFLAAAPTTQQTQGQGLESMLPMLLIMGFFIFFMWFSGRKQRKRAKLMAERKKNLKNGDRVMTDSGIYGVVDDMKDDIITIAIGPDKVRLVFNKSAIAVVEYDDDAVDLSREEAKSKEK